jgi:hypothetical protein
MDTPGITAVEGSVTRPVTSPMFEDTKSKQKNPLQSRRQIVSSRSEIR